jgi:hypothetical protein
LEGVGVGVGVLGVGVGVGVDMSKRICVESCDMSVCCALCLLWLFM